MPRGVVGLCVGGGPWTPLRPGSSGGLVLCVNKHFAPPRPSVPPRRQSRLLRFDDQGYELLTVDHSDGGRLRPDLAHSWASPASPAPVTPEHELLCDPAAGWLCSELDCVLPDEGGGDGSGSNGAPRVRCLPAGPNCMLAVQEELVVEYDMEMRAPVGLVAFLEPGEAGLGCEGVDDRGAASIQARPRGVTQAGVLTQRALVCARPHPFLVTHRPDGGAGRHVGRAAEA